MAAGQSGATIKRTALLTVEGERTIFAAWPNLAAQELCTD